MKKIIVFLSFFIVMGFFSSLIAMEKGLDGKIGTSYAIDPEKFGLNFAFDYYAVPDPYLAVGFETGLYWLKWERVVGEKQVGPAPAKLKADTNSYTIPFLAMAQIRMPHLQEKYNVIPYLNVGLGYSFMFLDEKQPAYIDTNNVSHEAMDDTDLYKGFTWEVLAGIAYKPGPTSNIHLLCELGYRSLKLKREEVELNMSGFVVTVGVRYPFSMNEE
jgi:hypothetical protein